MFYYINGKLAHLDPTFAVLDVGGDDRGALALGRLSPAIKEENDYEMLLVINGYRPLTRDVDSTLEIIREIEAAGGIPFTAIINNSNLGNLTDQKTVEEGHALLQAGARETGLPLVVTNDAHYLRKEDAEMQDVLLCVQTGLVAHIGVGPHRAVHTAHHTACNQSHNGGGNRFHRRIHRQPATHPSTLRVHAPAG